MVADWAVRELDGCDFKDKRRNERAVQILTQLGTVGESSPDAAQGKSTAALDGLYRFMRKSVVTPDRILQPHINATIQRTRQHRRVILVQDTTEIDLTKPRRQVQGAGPLSSNSRFGFYLHPLVAYSVGGVPLGVIACHDWTRETLDCESTAEEKKKKRNALPIEDKESFRWLDTTRRGRAVAIENPDTQYVSVADSESDIAEVFSEMADRPDNFHLIVRACQNRVVGECDVDGQEILARNITEALAQAPVLYCTQVKARERKAKTNVEKGGREQSRDARMARLEVRAVSVTLPMKPAASSTLTADKNKPLKINIVQAREIDPPAGAEAICWTLITTLPIDTIEQVKEVLDTYTVRWNIEVFFMTLKSGLGIEKLKYRQLSRYLNTTMFLLIVAWRVQCLTKAGREEPSASCEKYFEPNEWKPAWLVVHEGEPLPESPPTLGEFMIMVGILGGYVNRRQQGPPGVRTMWRGMRRLETLAKAYRVFGPRSP